MSLRVLLAEDHAVVRQGLRALLERAGLEVVGEAENGQDAVQRAEELHPDVAVLDVVMPVLNGIDAARAIAKVSDRTRIVILTMYTQRNCVLEAFRAGVRGYVTKSAAADELLLAIRSVCNGKTYLSPDVSHVMIDGCLAGYGDEQVLSDRERQVVQMVAEGKTSKEIADLLHITVKTVESHRTHIMAKLQIHDATGLVRYAIREGLIQP